jgi:hypothetical protein
MPYPAPSAPSVKPRSTRTSADATATDGRQAVLQAQNLLALIPIRA